MDGNNSTRDPASQSRCLVMFSGGRDSTIAALRLNQQGIPLHLITVCSGHLWGIARVQQRVRELQAMLPPSTPWLQVKQPTDLRTDTSFYEMTCLPCHHSYVVVSGVLASRQMIDRLAFGYARYQGNWPEQTPLAIERLTEVLKRHGIQLELPAYSLESREEAISALTAFGVSTASLEQKCMQQVSNVTLPPDRLAQQIAHWEQAIDRSMARRSEFSIEVLAETTVGSIA